MRKFEKPIGIIGGAGPMASAFLYSTLIELCQKKYGSEDYDQFPEIIIDSFPFMRGDPQRIREDISKCLAKLKKAGAELYCIACNSFHAFLPDVSHYAFVHLIEEALKEAEATNIKKALILAAPRTIELKLYERGSLECIYPPAKEQQRISAIIREVAGGKVDEDQGAELKSMVKHLHSMTPFDGVIIACTELPLIHKKFHLHGSLPILDTIEILARKLVELSISRP